MEYAHILPSDSVTVSDTTKISDSTYSSRDNHFNQKLEDNESQSARKLLGEVANQLSDIELNDILTEISFLAESWLDDFERKTFKGHTLTELMNNITG